MKALVVKPHSVPEIRELPDLEAMRECVGGPIQAVYPWDDIPVALVCDEEGLYHDADWNRYIREGLVIKGTFFICGIKEDDFADIPEELAEMFTESFLDPDEFIETPFGLAVVTRHGVRSVT